MIETLVTGLVIVIVFSVPFLVAEVVDYIIDVRHCAQRRREFARVLYSFVQRSGPLDQETIGYWEKACK